MNLEHERQQTSASILSHIFIHRCDSEVIDRNQAAKKPAWSVTVQMEEEVQSISDSMLASWWNIPSAQENALDDMAAIRRLLTKMYYFHIGMHVYLPFMRRRPTDPLYQRSGPCCVASTKDLIKRHLVLRSNMFFYRKGSFRLQNERLYCVYCVDCATRRTSANRPTRWSQVV